MELIVIAFDHFADARAAMAGLRSLERQGQIRFEDTAIVERDPDGTAHVKNEVSGTTETAATIGALIGGLMKSSNADATLAALRGYRGDVIQTTLDSEAEAALRETLD